MSLLVPVVFLALATWALAIQVKNRRSRSPLPPGPPRLPVIGNILDLPAIQPWVKFREWCDAYGSDVIHIQVPLQPIIVLGSFEAAIDLLEKRAKIYSDRIETVMNELMTWNFNLGFMRYGPKWKAHRKMFHQSFHPEVVANYRPVQLEYTRKFLSWTLKSRERSAEHVRQMVTSIVVAATYGKKISGGDDPYILVAEKALEGTTIASVPGTFWVDFLPFLRGIPSWVPGASFKVFAEKYLPYVIAMRDKPYEEVKAALRNGSAPESIARTLLETNYMRYKGTDDEAFYDEVARNVTGVAYAAGTETTTSSCSAFLLAMALFPEVQKRAQAELDRVIGPHRLPEYDDIEQMPYIRALAMETLRWFPTVPIALPHAVSADDEYKGLHIPKGAMIIANVWAMLRDASQYPEPEKFIPERFLDSEGRLDDSARNPEDIAFGFGRRICLGRHFSKDTLSIFIATTLHVFNINAGIDSTGAYQRLNDQATNAMILMPKQVPCGMKPRSEQARKLIQEAALETDGHYIEVRRAAAV